MSVFKPIAQLWVSPQRILLRIQLMLWCFPVQLSKQAPTTQSNIHNTMAAQRSMGKLCTNLCLACLWINKTSRPQRQELRLYVVLPVACLRFSIAQSVSHFDQKEQMYMLFKFIVSIFLVHNCRPTGALETWLIVVFCPSACIAFCSPSIRFPFVIMTKLMTMTTMNMMIICDEKGLLRFNTHFPPSILVCACGYL